MQLQVKEGIDAVIVDSVLAIRKGLTGPDGSSAPTKTETEGPVVDANGIRSGSSKGGATASTVNIEVDAKEI